ncbi:MAG: metallophosphoesterase [Alphaproteobacteria bacterium]|nr:metallophosphoesterase [Alphaproteobacteria bacterium]
MRKRRSMVRWFNPLQLAETAVRVAISSIFGEFADRRELTAITRHIDPDALDPAYDYSGVRSDFWVDYIADTGDGWNPTYAMARLLATPKLTVNGCPEELPLAGVVVMGGDQVYPTASRDEYAERLVAPFDEAAKTIPKRKKADLYAIPGNHDWYDGLLAFLGLFSRRRIASSWSRSRDGRVVGGRKTKQVRSYFAIKLPHDWWIWGVDVQLKGYIDQPQIDFFARAADEWMAEGSRLIICTGMPSWAYVDPDDPEKEFRNFSYLQGIVDAADRGHRLCLVLTGDSHHYSRYLEGDCQYVTAGGGGAFLHPTHHLEDKSFDWRYPRPGVRQQSGITNYRREFEIAKDQNTGAESLFPARKTSRRLAWRNLAFAWLNWEYTVTLAAIIGIFTWLISANARIGGWKLSNIWADGSDPWVALCGYAASLVISPWPLILLGAALLGYYGFADFKGWRRWLAGGLHALVQGGVAIFSTVLLAFWIRDREALLVLLAGVIGGVLAATVMGLYLLVCLRWFGKHWNEAFSSLRIEDYKCFLRLRIDRNGNLKIFPVGLTRVPRDDGTPSPANPELTPHLIETPIDIT